jgi:hypothetical protein
MEGGRCAPHVAAEPVDVDRHDPLLLPAVRNPAKQIVTSRDGYGGTRQSESVPVSHFLAP